MAEKPESKLFSIFLSMKHLRIIILIDSIMSALKTALGLYFITQGIKEKIRVDNKEPSDSDFIGRVFSVLWIFGGVQLILSVGLRLIGNRSFWRRVKARENHELQQKSEGCCKCCYFSCYGIVITSVLCYATFIILLPIDWEEYGGVIIPLFASVAIAWEIFFDSIHILYCYKFNRVGENEEELQL